MNKYTILVCGGRDFNDKKFVDKTLDEIMNSNDISKIIQGEASGADKLAKLYALEKGIPLVSLAADWNKFGKAAGPLRNDEMLKLNPNLVIAFPGGKGTKDMVKKSIQAGIQTIEYFVFEGEIKSKIHNL